MIDAELVEDRRSPRGGSRRVSRRRSGSASISRSSARSRSPASSAANASPRSVVPAARPRRPRARARSARPGRRRRSCPGTRERISSASSVSPRRSRILASATAASARDGSQLERLAQRLLVAALHEPVRLGGQQRVEELLDGLRRLRADELGDHLAVAESLDRRDALDPEVARQALVGVDVDLGQLELSRARVGGALQHRTELTTRPAPLGPEVDDDRKLMRAVDDRCLEICLGDVHTTHASNVADDRTFA